MVFSPAVRVLLGFILAGATFLLTSDIFAVGGDAQQYIGSLAVFIGAIGIVPAKPGEITKLIKPQLAVFLTAITTTLAFLLPNLDADPGLRGILIAVVTFFSAQFIPSPLGIPIDEPAAPVTPPGMQP